MILISSMIKNILYSNTSLMRWLRFFLLISILILGVMRLLINIKVLDSDLIYKKDVLVEYLVSKAVINGIDPYTSLDELANRFIGSIIFFPHPSPYPPPFILFSLPFGLLEFKLAAVVWFLIEVMLVVWIAYQSLRLLNLRTKVIGVLVASLVMFAWHPFMEDLLYGQLSILLLTFILVTSYLRKKGEDFWAGIVLGLPIAVKLFAWPLLIFFILKKKWEIVIGSAVTIIATNILAGFIIGFNQAFNYYLTAMKDLSGAYRSFAFNYSLWTVGPRLFSGTESEVLVGLIAPPLIESSVLANAVSILLPLFFIILGLKWALRAKKMNTAFAIMVGVSVLVNPVAWVHYFVILLFPILILINLLKSHMLPARETVSFLISAAILLLIDNTTIIGIVAKFSQGTDIAGNMQVSFIVGLITLVPVVLVIGYMVLLRRLDMRSTTYLENLPEAILIP
jgi:hypothetical protein